jgi:hypothetical protein
VRRSTTEASRQAQARYSVAVRMHGLDDPRTGALRREWEFERYLASLADAAALRPTDLTPHERERLMELVADISGESVTPGEKIDN